MKETVHLSHCFSKKEAKANLLEGGWAKWSFIMHEIVLMALMLITKEFSWSL